MTEQVNRSGLRPVAPATSDLLDAVPAGLLLVSPDATLMACNREARRLLGLEGNRAIDMPGLHDIEVGTPSRRRALLKQETGDLELVAHPVAGGHVLVHITPATARETATKPALEDDCSLFENAVYGIYRDTLDGRPLRANPALARLNGYETPEDYLAAVAERPGNWYVDPDRSREFHRLLERDGRVHDFVSEVYRHRTRERFWITENAWYLRDETGRPIAIEGTIQDATERVEAVAAIERQANTDALTGTASRFRFMQILHEQTVRRGMDCALLTIDLDRFKDVNDMLGHGAGDAVLKEVAQRLMSIGGSHAVVGRLGGDEFALLLTGRHCHMHADMTAAAIVGALREPISIGDCRVMVGASIGIAVHPAQAATAEELLTHADLALYHVKAEGRNGFRFFDQDMRARIARRRALERELSDAVMGDELELHYQPVFDAASGATAGFEALLRWNHPRRGLLLPGEFLAVAEESGLMVRLGNWVVRRACSDAARLPDPLFVAVNVSPLQVRAPDFVDEVRRILEDTGLSASRLMLEITETAILSREASVTHVIDGLLALGIGLALDDFGTGYSSLSHLQRFAFSALKIDRSFVAGIEGNPANRAVIRAVLTLARELGIDVVAEGIETGSQAALLRSEGCRFLQGHHFGTPAPLADTLATLAVQDLTGILAGRLPDPNPQALDPTRRRPFHNTL